MKKIVFTLIAIVVLLLIAAYSLLFTSFGNSIIKEYAQKNINKNPSTQIQIDDFLLTMSKIKLKAQLNGLIEIDLNGDYSLFSQNIKDMMIIINSKDLSMLNIKEKININANLQGKFNDLSLNANGNIFNAPLKLQASIKNYYPYKLNYNTSNLDLEKILKIINKDYLSGFANINLDINEFDKNDIRKSKILANISAKIKAKDSFKKDFGIDLKKLEEININSNNTLADFKLKPNFTLNSKLLNIDTNFDEIDLNKLDAKGIININISDLSFINENLNSNLNTKLNVEYKDKIVNILADAIGKNISLKNINLNLKNDDLKLKANAIINSALIKLKNIELANVNIDASINTKTSDIKANINGALLDSKINANLNKNALKADISNLSIPFALLDLEKMATSKINANIDIKDIYKVNGQITSNINLNTIKSVFKKNYDLDLDANLLANAKIILNSAKDISFSLDAKSNMLDNLQANGTFKNNILNSNFNLNTKLANYNELLKKNMKGQIKLNGDASFNKILLVNAKSDEFFGGKLNASLKADDFNASLTNVSVEELANSLDFIDIYKASANANLTYNLKSAKGFLKADLGKGSLKQHKAIVLIDKITNISKIVFDNANVNVDMNKNLYTINANANAKNAQIQVSNALYNLDEKSLNAPLSINLNNNIVKGVLVQKGENISFNIDKKNAANNILKAADKLLKVDENSSDDKKKLKGFLNKLIKDTK